MFYSLIIPVYNRPEDIEDLLSCLSRQIYKTFEVIIVESGSDILSDVMVVKYKNLLDIRYYMYKNEGQGFSRNYGMSKAKGEYFVILDSDLLLDDNYLSNLNSTLSTDPLDAFGGPDRAHDSFSPTQKAIDYTFTSVLTTGGIRGKKNHVGKFYPRSFNMGFSRKVYEATKGFKYPFFGEDIELSRRIMRQGFKTGLVPEAYVYHKRKTKYASFYKQMFFFGKARINIFKMFPDTLKITYFFPATFVAYCIFLVILTPFKPLYGFFVATPLMSYIFMVFLGATIKYNLSIGILSILAFFTQMFGYGLGFMKDFIKIIIFKSEYRVKNKDR